ncbi:hypothetical protein D9M68_295520 [compost metagenome]
MALGLHGTVVVALVEGETADQGANRTAARIERNQGALRGGDLGEAQAAIVLALHPYQVADLHDVGRLLRARAEAVGVEEGARPFHAVPADGLFLPAARQDEDAALLHLGDDDRLQAADALLLGQFLLPGLAGHAGQAGFRAAVAVTLVVTDQPLTHGVVGGLLQLAGHCGGDVEALGIGVAAIAADHFRTGHLGDVRCVELRRGDVVTGVDGFVQRRLVARLVDLAQFVHASEDPVAALLAAFRVDQWIEARRRFGQAGDHRHLREAQVADRFAVIDLSGGFDAVGAVAQVDLVDVELEDLVLAQFALDLQGEQDFVDLAREAAFAGEEVVFRHLHGDRAAASLYLAAFQ